jgi:pyruvate dehydrogenase (quinone)
VEALRKRRQEIRFIAVRHEESAAFMASGFAKYTGRLGACIPTGVPNRISQRYWSFSLRSAQVSA